MIRRASRVDRVSRAEMVSTIAKALRKRDQSRNPPSYLNRAAVALDAVEEMIRADERARLAQASEQMERLP